jgi:hypothetical protein
MFRGWPYPYYLYSLYSMNSVCVLERVCDGEHLHDLWPHGDPEQGPEHLLCSTTVQCTQWTPSVCRGVFVTGNTSTTSGLTVTLSRDQSSDCAIEAGALVLADQVRFLTISLSIVCTVPNGLMTVHVSMFRRVQKLFSEYRLFLFSR